MEQDWRNIEIGKKYKLEDGYSFQAEVEVLDKYVESTVKDYIDYKVKILKVYRGDVEEGETDWIGKSLDPRYTYIVQKLKFLDISDEFTYD